MRVKITDWGAVVVKAPVRGIVVEVLQLNLTWRRVDVNLWNRNWCLMRIILQFKCFFIPETCTHVNHRGNSWSPWDIWFLWCMSPEKLLFFTQSCAVMKNNNYLMEEGKIFTSFHHNLQRFQRIYCVKCLKSDQVIHVEFWNPNLIPIGVMLSVLL